jgi:hypothetical protein
LAFATFLTLVIIPTIYSEIDDIILKFKRKKKTVESVEPEAAEV